MTDAGAARRVHIENASIDHAEGMARLHGSLFDEPWSTSGFRQLLEHPGSLAFLATASDAAEPIGVIVGRVAADEAELLTLGVHAHCQRSGIGRRLVEALCQAAREAKARRLYLEVAAGNIAALRLYERLGAMETGRRKAYYQRPDAPAEDAVTLAIPL